MTSIVKTLSIMLGITMLSACATNQDHGYPFEDGWRHAKVHEMGDHKTVMHATIHMDCRPSLAHQRASTRFAVVSYSHGSSPKWQTKRVVAIPDGLQVSVGDKVHIKVNDCATPLAKPDERRRQP